MIDYLNEKKMKALKNNPLVIAIPLLMVAMISVSCTKDKKPTYSCNPKINKWVIENLGVINYASRSQLSELPLPFQKASYQSLSPERKYELWNEKLEYEKNRWDEPIQVMINDLQSNMKIDWFNDTLYASHYAYLELWEEQMLTMYMDTSEYAFSFMQLATEEELEKVLLHPETISYTWVQNTSPINEYNKTRDVPVGGEQLNCICNWDATCASMNAGLCIKENTCNQTPDGCGLLWQYPCKGECENHMVVIDDEQ